MKTIIILTAALFAISPAYAEVCYPPVEVQVEDVAKEIAEQYIELQGWCDQPPTDAKPGQIVIYYERENGKCVAKVKVQK